MRKLINFFCILTLSFFLLGSSQASFDGILLKDFPNDSKVKEGVSPSKTIIEKIIILPNTAFNQAEAADIIERINHLPAKMLERIDEKGIHLKLFVGKLTDNPTASHLKGIVPRGYTSNKTWDDVPGIGGSKTVLVKIGNSEKGKGHGSINLELHELAHSIDRYVYNGIRYDKQFEQIWNEEKSVLFPMQNYFLNYPEEYFAETFAMYYLAPSTRNELLEKAPKTYSFIKELSNK